MKPVFQFVIGIATGTIVTLVAAITLQDKLYSEATILPTVKYPLQATLYRFHINSKNKKVFDDWVKWHQMEKEAIATTMEREKMYVESVFRDTLNNPNVIYWLAFEGTGGENYSTSNLAADQKHATYMKQILTKGSKVTLKTDFLMLPPFLEKSIAEHQATGIKQLQ
ncbi:DUF6176 family protein [Pedobacter mendelii]|uniref:Uncharacterized protein n=1 Tax=Pedobacter mendelii TaxID=1908240 RepID=A0ABQ2BDC3_9SPHI|nr:DUF6176 family protein [Pedobacter mendelii]GGI23311.1 hypothetical protein GCM10008119_07010 [Pedobacter mendelii]